MNDSVVGIVAYGAYVPVTRLPLAMIHGGQSREGGPEKAVAAFDEDTITLAVAAATNCLMGMDRASIDGLYLATTSSPFREKQSAAFVARALDLRTDIDTVDFTNSLRSAAAAIIAAVNSVRASPGKSILVVATDARLAAPRSPLEMNLGDAAAAFLVGSEQVMVKLNASVTCSDELYDVWRTQDDAYLRAWEDRFNVVHGYRENMLAVCDKLFETCGTSAQDYDTAVLYGPDARSHAELASELALGRAKLQEPLFGRVGNCGAALVPLLLVCALEKRSVGERLLVVFYGDGAQALELEVLAEGPLCERNVNWHLQRGRSLSSYDAYLKSRHLFPAEHDPKAGDGVPATVHYRERDADINFLAQRCTQCGTVHFPACRVCYGCYAKDLFEPVRLSDRPGRVLSYSLDYFFPSPEPPVIVGVCEVDNGARVYVQMTEADPKALRCDLPVEFVFRKIHEAGKRPNYFWKSRPLMSQVTQEVNA